MKTNLNFIKRITFIPIFTGLIFTSILGIKTIKNDKNYDSQLNEPQISSNTSTIDKEHITQLEMGGNHSSALTNKGNVYTWGYNSYGQLGDGSQDNKQIPTKITDNFNLSGDEKITQLSMGYAHSSALTNEGNVFTWGYNYYGQLGDGSQDSKLIPTKITDNFNLSGDEKITQLNMGEDHSSALTDKGNVYTWGWNIFGQLGDGSTTDKHTPIKITDNFNLSVNEKITQLSLGSDFSSALTNKNSLYSWGYNNLGQLGYDNNIIYDSPLPVKVINEFKPIKKNEKIRQINAGDRHASALTDEGTVYIWGYNYHGQLGNNENSLTPNKILNITDNFNLSGDEKITHLNMGENHSSALTNEGNVYTWGDNHNNKLGDNSTDQKNIPTKITDSFSLLKDEKITQLNMGSDHSSALTNQGNVFTWGDNYFGQLGRPTNQIHELPWKIVNIIHYSKIFSIFKSNVTSNSMTISFNVDKKDQAGNVVIKDKHGTEKATKNGVDGQDSITIDNLESNTTFTGWTIEVDGNGPVPIEDFTTLPIKSEVKFDDITKTTHDSVTINFTVTKNDQSGNVVIKDKDGVEKATRNGLDGPDSITIEGLKSNTTFTGWTIEVDGNGKVSIEEFTTLPIKSEVKFNSITNKTHDSVTINFNVDKNDQSGDVVIKDNKGEVKGTKTSVDGQESITIDNLKSNTTYTGWKIEVDGNGELPIKDFTTVLIKSELLSHKLTDITLDSVIVNFNVDKKDQAGNVVIRDNAGDIIGWKNGVNGSSFIFIDGLKPNTTFTGWTIEVDGNDKVAIPEFKTHPLNSEILFFNTTNETSNSVTINFVVTKNNQKGNVVIRDNNGNIKDSKERINGPDSITIEGLKSNTEFIDWTIEVDGNSKVKIPSFKTKKYTSNEIKNNLDLNIKGEIKSSNKEITLIYESNQQLNGIWEHTITYKNGKEQKTSLSNDKYSVNNTNKTIEKTYSLDQSIKNIEKIETTYEVDGYIVPLDSYTGSADKVLGIKGTKPGLSQGSIRGIILGSITGVALIMFIIYFSYLRKIE